MVDVTPTVPHVVDVTPTVPHVVDVTQTVPNLVAVTQTVPNVVAVTQTVPNLVAVTQTVPNVVAVTQTVPNVVAVTQTVPNLVAVTQTVPNVVAVTQTVPNVVAVTQTVPNMLLCRNHKKIINKGVVGCCQENITTKGIVQLPPSTHWKTVSPGFKHTHITLRYFLLFAINKNYKTQCCVVAATYTGPSLGLHGCHMHYFIPTGLLAATSTFSPVSKLSSDGLRMRVCHVWLCISWAQYGMN